MGDGFKSVNWYTILNTESVNSKLGGAQALRQRLEAAGLKLLEYPGGVMVKAGEYPSLGWNERDPMPAPYVLANHILKPARAPVLHGLHLGSVMGEARFTADLSSKWARRFDVPNDQSPPPLPHPTQTASAIGVFAVSGEPCPRSGLWSPRAEVPLPDSFVDQGSPMPMAEWHDAHDVFHQQAIKWQLVKPRD